MARPFVLRHTRPTEATLSLLCLDGPIRPVHLMIPSLQKQSLAIV